jgi:hypothetical protein
MMMMMMMMMTGQPSVLYYADSLLQDVGMASSAAVMIGLFKMGPR